jgi:hypothetical protein
MSILEVLGFQVAQNYLQNNIEMIAVEQPGEGIQQIPCG